MHVEYISMLQALSPLRGGTTVPMLFGRRPAKVLYGRARRESGTWGVARMLYLSSSPTRAIRARNGRETRGFL